MNNYSNNILKSDLTIKDYVNKINSFNKKITDKEVNLVEVIDEIFKEKLSTEKYVTLWKKDPDIIYAKDKNSNTQMTILNKYFYKYLILVNDSYEIRTYLLPDVHSIVWQQHIINKVIPYILENKLPINFYN